MIKRNDLLKCANTGLQAFTAFTSEVKELFKANRGIAQKFTKDREWVSTDGGTYASNGIYRLDPTARTASETVTFPLRDNGSGDYRAVDGDNLLRGYTTLAHLVAKRGFKHVTYEDYAGRKNNLSALDARYGKPVSVTFDASAL